MGFSVALDCSEKFRSVPFTLYAQFSPLVLPFSFFTAKTQRSWFCVPAKRHRLALPFLTPARLAKFRLATTKTKQDIGAYNGDDTFVPFDWPCMGILQVVESMAKHHPDLIMCRKQPGIAIGRLCEKCDGKCVICDSYVRPCTLVRVCDECNYGSFQGRCVICGGVGISDAYYCKECTQQEKDRDGCPKIVNLGSAKTDLFYERKKYGFKKR
ncbi:hypothetical protein VNO77_43320 [Canavalia gladiata]|uniref:PHD finger protein 5A n=1 Tax=Canavalia gladiata TaxID=3824 RepID=A0AAN9JW49_CANGL